MAVHVKDDSGSFSRFDEGVDWHIDDEGYLHIRDASGKHIAAAHRNAWIMVTHEPKI